MSEANKALAKRWFRFFNLRSFGAKFPQHFVDVHRGYDRTVPRIDRR
jgi:hypothetical protein